MTESAAEYFEVRWRVKDSGENWAGPRRISPVGEIVITELDRTKEYEMQVRAVSNCGAQSIWVPSDYMVPVVPPLPAVNVPTGSGMADGIQLDWGDGTSTRADLQYEISRAPAVGAYVSTPPPAGDPSWTRVAIVSGTTWVDAVADTADYWYRIRTVDYTGNVGAWAVIAGPAAATVSTPAVNQDLQQAKQALTAVQGQADTLRTDVDATLAQVQALQGQVGDILQADVWVSTKTYPNGDLVQYSGKLYRSLIDGNINHQPAGATDSYWEYIGNYASLGAAVGANAANIATVQNTVTQQGNTIAANSQSISQQAAQIAGKADASALSATNTTVTQQGNQITAMAQDVSLLGAHNAGKTAFVLNQGTVQVDSAGTTLGQYMTSVQAANTAVNARVDSEQTARANGDAANASAITAVRTGAAHVGQNLIYNPSGEAGTTGWSSSGVDVISADKRVDGYALHATPAGATGYTTNVVEGIAPSWQMTLSGEVWADTPGGYLFIGLVYWGDSGYLGETGALPFSAGNWYRQSVTATLPANCTSVDVRVFSSIARSFVLWRKLKLEQGASPTPFTNDVTIGGTASATQALTTTVTNQGGQITANANAIQAVTARMPGGTGTVATASDVTAVQNQVNASWTLMLDVNGRVSGVKAQNTGTVSSFAVVADQFSIVAPAGGARTEFSSGNWRVYDAAGTLRVRLGVW